MKKKIFVITMFCIVMFQSYGQNSDKECVVLLDEYEVLIETLVNLASTYHENMNDKDNRQSTLFVNTKKNINKWYSKWNTSSCIADEKCIARYDALETKKKNAIRLRYSLQAGSYILE